MKKIYLILTYLLLINGLLSGQERNITGKVTDATGEPLIGVTIVIKETTTGTITDIDGNYSISAQVGSQLKFSFNSFLTREALTISEPTSFLLIILI